MNRIRRPDNPMRRIPVFIPEQLLTRVDEIAERNDLSRGDAIRIALRRWLAEGAAPIEAPVQ